MLPIELELKVAGEAFGRHLQRLPLEILAESRRSACSNPYDLLALSHVNRRFRCAALSMADVWSDVSSDMSIDFLRLCLERSKNAGLRVVLGEEKSSYTFEDFYAISEDPDTEDTDSRFKSCVVKTARYCTRWEVMEIILPVKYFVPRDMDRYVLYRVLKEYYDTLDVPRLETFSVFHRGRLSGSSRISHAEILDIVLFYRSWKAPKLRTLLFTGGIIPVPMLGVSIETLSLDLRGEGRSRDFFPEMHDLHTFLRKTPSLRNLEIWTYSTGVSNSSQTCDFSTITLEHLQELTFTVDHTPLVPETLNVVLFSSLVGCLHLPALSTLSVKLAIPSPDWDCSVDEDATDLVASLIPRPGHVSNLTSLSLFVFDSSTCRFPDLRVKVALDQFPSLRSLTIGITGELVVEPEASLHTNVRNRSSLEQINLLACDLGAEVFLEWVVNQLSDSDGDGLRKLNVVVKRCESARRENLLELISSDKLRFEGGIRLVSA